MPERRAPTDPQHAAAPDGQPARDPRLAALIDAGLALHRAGRLAEARTRYEEALAQVPEHPDALHLLGVIDSQSGDAARAIDRIGRAIQATPEVAAYHTNLGNALLALGRAQDALDSYRRAIALDPQQTDAHANAGRALSELGRFDEALTHLDIAIEQRPAHAETLNRKGNALLRRDRVEEALVCYEAALAANPRHSRARLNRARALVQLGRHQDAEQHYRAALSEHPDSARLHFRLADTLKAQGRDLEAVASYDRAIACPDAAERPRRIDAAAWNNRGNALSNLGRIDEAIESFGNAIERLPEHAEAWFNLGNALRAQQRHQDALACYDRVLQLRPEHAICANNRGVVLGALGRTAESIASLDRAILLDPTNPEPAWNKGIALLLNGDFREGWRLYEKRWTNDNTGMKRRVLEQPLWLGEPPIAGKTVLLHAEQGFGDTVQFCRFAREVAQRGARVLLEVQAPLKPLMAGLEGVASVHARGEPLPAFDLHCPLLSLPLALGLELGALPGPRGYLRADPQRVAHWQGVLGPRRVPRIGIAWSGNPSHGNDHNRSIPLAQLIAHLPKGPEYVSLQRDCRVTDRATLTLHPTLRHFGEALEDFGDTAAVCQSLDLVITVDTAIAHLNAALDRPTWVLLPFVPDWRWMRDRTDSPWYPSVRLFRQTDIGHWGSTLRALRAAVDEWLAGPPTPAAGLDEGNAWCERGHALRLSGRFEDSLRSYDQAIARRPEQSAAWLGKALVLTDQGALHDARTCFDQAVTHAPDDPQAHFLQATVLHRLGEPDLALTALDRVVALRPDHLRAWDRRGLVLEALGRVDEAIDSHHRALTLDPEDRRASRNLGMALLLRGELTEGFRRYEQRWDVEPMASAMPAFAQPRWRGDRSLAGRTLLLHSEQGLGDTLQFCRYASLAQAQGATVLLEVPDPLRPLMTGLEGVHGLLRRGDPVPPFDLHSPLLSLPFAFGTTLDTIPSRTPYLFADPARVAHWRTRLSARTRPLIGLAWRGNPKHPKDAQRSLPLSRLLAHLPTAAHYVSLLPDLQPDETRHVQAAPHVIIPGHEDKDFLQTAELCAAVDLIVSVDTSIAHLAGALGRPTWVLLPFAPDWRWMLQRRDTPWYPATTLYRQPARDDWTSVLERLAEDLTRWITGRVPT